MSVPASRILVAALLLAAGALVPVAPAGASEATGTGAICGTVRDALTLDPIPRAGVFVRDTAGAYTGFHAATDDSGRFCVDGLPAGTYDLEVRVDDYRIGWLSGVTVTGSTVSVPPIDGTPPARLAPPAPNPARGPVLLRWSLAAPGPVALRVVDAQGRLVQGWSSPSEDAGDHALTWNLRGRDGRTLPAGVYYLVLDAGGVRRVRTLIRLP